MTVKDDRELLRRIRDDEPGAFEEFVDRHGDRIYGFGVKVCGEPEDAADVAQETLIQAFRSLKDLKDPAALKSWLYRVTSNACMMKRRKGKFEPDRELSLDQMTESGGDRTVAPDLRPDEALQREELRRAVRRAIDGLPMHYRIVLVMRDMEQLSTRETAEALQLEETTVKMRLHRARGMVRRRLELAAGQEMSAREQLQRMEQPTLGEVVRQDVVRAYQALRDDDEAG